ncbi:MAG: 5-methyltetrahydrofolate--homocysteine methyltransferase [Clostridiales bacterium]|nr:5-methyltetrahydrofolate--homocysteine methyltransferase [Clostridiales bacterium]
MTKQEFKKLTNQRLIMLDGATGSNLIQRGMPIGVCPEKWILEHKDIMKELQREFVDAGSDILYAPTFTCNRIKLSEYGLHEQVISMNRELAQISIAVKEEAKQANGKDIFVAGDLTMTGEQLFPIGTLDFEELVEVYKEQVAGLLDAGVDLFVIETMMSLQECRAAVLAVKESCDLPLMVTLTFEEDMRTLYGTDPVTAAVVMEAMGVDAVGVNCSTGPEKMCLVVEAMQPYVTIPLIAKPNAGLPHLEEGITVYDLEAEAFSVEAMKLVHAGASIVGGCCGSTPEHIRAFKKNIENRSLPSRNTSKRRLLTNERNTLSFGLEDPFLVVGERINPTGKKALQAELLEGKMDIVVKMAQEQEALGAAILDINMGMNGIDEDQMMQKVIYEVLKVSNLPLCIDSSYISVLEHALRIYPGRALINSISLEREKFEKLIPLAKKYGAMFVLLPLSDAGLPKNLEEKKEIIHKILERAYSLGLTKEDIIVDGLVTTVGANQNAALETLETIRYCKMELSLATICGLSNISFGLPERMFVNSAFLSLAIREGLTMAIANPSQTMLMGMAFATDLLQNKEGASLRYIEQVSAHPLAVSSTASKPQKVEAAGAKEVREESKHPIYLDVLKGNDRTILDDVNKALSEGETASMIVDNRLIPAINETGELFDKKIYFLPQLISSAQAMKKAIDYLEPMLASKGEVKKLGCIVMATVAGDIHDIGKNLVVLMLKNYGFDVIDLGKDVPADEIIRVAKEKHADVIGLSALMTTTMMEMKRVVMLARKEGVAAKIIIGGAVITKSFADEIGADGYSKDAKEAVLLVKELLGI